MMELTTLHKYSTLWQIVVYVVVAVVDTNHHSLKIDLLYNLSSLLLSLNLLPLHHHHHHHHYHHHYSRRQSLFIVVCIMIVVWLVVE